MGSLSAHRVIVIVAVVYTLLLAWGSLTSVPATPSAPENFDKMLHTTAYIGLVMLWLVSLRRFKTQRSLPPIKLWVVIIAALAYGIIIEFLQGTLTEDRTPDVWDVVANSVGVLIGVLIFVTVVNKSERLKSIF